jgi:hypothetical protein
VFQLDFQPLDSHYGILFGPEILNQVLQARGIESFAKSMQEDFLNLFPEYKDKAFVRIRQSVAVKPNSSYIDTATYRVTGQIQNDTTDLFELTFNVTDDAKNPLVTYELKVFDSNVSTAILALKKVMI